MERRLVRRSDRPSWLISIVSAAIVGCGGGGDGRPQPPADQQAIAQEIDALGGLYAVDKKEPERGIVVVRLANTKADDALVAKLASLSNLRELDLNHTQITNGAVASLKKLTKLTALDVGNTKLTKEAVQSLVEALPETAVASELNVDSSPPAEEAAAP